MKFYIFLDNFFQYGPFVSRCEAIVFLEAKGKDPAEFQIDGF